MARGTPLTPGTKSIRKILLYKVATPLVASGAPTLEQCIKSSLTASPKFGGRKWTTSEDDDSFTACARWTNEHGMTFLEIVGVTPDVKPIGSRLNDDAGQIDLEEAELLDKKGRPLQLVDHVIYVGVKGNDVVLLQSQSMRADAAEAYFLWWFRKYEVIGDGQRFSLSNRIPPAKLADIRSATGFTIRDSVQYESVPSQSANGVVASKRVRPSGIGGAVLLGFLRSVKGLVDLAEELEVNGVENGTSLNVCLEVSWPRPPKDETAEMVDRIGTKLRHVDDQFDYEIMTRNGPITKDQIILKHPRYIPCINKRPITGELWKAMAGWLDELRSSGAIE